MVERLRAEAARVERLHADAARAERLAELAAADVLREKERKHRLEEEKRLATERAEREETARRERVAEADRSNAERIARAESLARAKAEQAKADMLATETRERAERDRAETEKARRLAESLANAERLAKVRGRGAAKFTPTVRVFAPRGDAAQRELELLRTLPLANSTISCPEVFDRKWRVEQETAVFCANKIIEPADIARLVADWIGALDKDSPWSQIVVIIETRRADEWEDSYECAYHGASITLTSHEGGFFGALVYAPNSVVLVDYEKASFYSCTLVREPAPPLDAEKQILKADYCAGTNGARLRAESMYVCHRKVLAFARAEKRGPGAHEIVHEFKRVFVTSDIHADLRKFVQILRACGLITIGAFEHKHIYAVHELGEPNEEQMIYDLVWDVRWAAEKTMLVICGDLIDGLRNKIGTGDERGSYEFLLHCLLFNLRIQARRMGSEVRFTIGNHDAGTVTAFPPYGFGRYMRYVDDKHAHFAPSGCAVSRAKEKLEGWSYDLFARRDMLLPFYACSPYIMLRFGKVAFVHAGFVEKGVTGVYADAIRRQKQLDKAPLEHDTDLVAFFAPTSSDSHTPYVLWSTGYATLDHIEACDAANEAHQKFELIAVGHCVTHLYEENKLGELGAAQCGDTTHGCVITRDCRERPDDTAPLIALVDTGMSAAFRAEGNDARGVGMLLLDKQQRETDELRVVDNYYVYRISALEGMSVLDLAGNEQKVEMPASAFGRGRQYV
jgi:hypothetical protein